MKFNKHLFLFLGFFLIVATTEACTKEGSYVLPEVPPLLVANGNPVVGENLVLYVSASTPLYELDSLSSEISPTAILEQEGKPLESMPLIVTSTNRYFRSSSPIRAGYKYSISISADGFNGIRGSTYAPENAVLQPIVIDEGNITKSYTGGDTVVMRVPFTVTVDNLKQTDSLFAFRLLSKRVLNGPGEPEIEDMAKFAADGNTFANLHETLDQTFVINQKVWANNPGQKVKLEALLVYREGETQNLSILLEWRTVSKEYYLYHLSLSRQGDPTLPFSTPDATYNNIINGLGNFSAYARRQYEVIVF